MSEGKLVNVFCWRPTPGLQWRCHEGVSGVTVDAESKQAAIDHFNSIWNFRTPVQWVYEAPKKRPSDPAQASAAIEGDTIATKFHRSILRAFHVDLNGPKKRWSADQIVQIINEKWTEAAAK